MKARDYRARARAALQGKWTIAALLVALAMAFSNSFGLKNILNSRLSVPHTLWGVEIQLPAGPGWLLAALVLALYLIGLGMQTGRYAIARRVLNGETPAARDLMPETIFGKCVWMNVLRVVLTELLLLLLVVPGIIAALNYSMAPYLLLENPEMSAVQALRESRRRMKGNKWKMACLFLSFLGWMLLSVILLRLLQNSFYLLLPGAQVVGAMVALILMVLVYGVLFVYMDVALCAFFRDICSRKP